LNKYQSEPNFALYELVQETKIRQTQTNKKKHIKESWAALSAVGSQLQ